MAKRNVPLGALLLAIPDRRAICAELGANVYGRLDAARGLIDARDYSRAREELRAVASFLDNPGPPPPARKRRKNLRG